MSDGFAGFTGLRDGGAGAAGAEAGTGAGAGGGRVKSRMLERGIGRFVRQEVKGFESRR